MKKRSHHRFFNETIIQVEPSTVVHENPLWRDRADFIVFADIQQEGLPRRWEQLWAKRLGGGEFQICCLPFFVYDLSLGDEVATGPKDGKQYVVERRTKESGRFLFRLWFGSSPRTVSQAEIAERVLQLEGQVERYSRNLLAVDAANQQSAQQLADFFAEQEREGRLTYEAGRRTNPK